MILEAHPENRVMAIDRDGRAVRRGAALAERYFPRLRLAEGSFAGLGDLIVQGPFDGLLADLGMSTDQLYEGRGFSFRDDSLDMRMDESLPVTAEQLLNERSERELFLIFARGGVGKNAKSLASLIARTRPFRSAEKLAMVIADSGVGRDRSSGSHPATVVFQALRMEVNGELDQIAELFEYAPSLVRKGGRMAVITFHSLEDQHVVSRMRGWASRGSRPAHLPGPREEPLGKLVFKKPIVPSDDEVRRNPASRSARLRVFEFEGHTEKK
jgi:16S rRNA (cytosine1402-N4)-methyltransferase